MVAILKMKKMRYLQNRLTNFGEILYNHTILVFQSLPAVQKS